MTATRRVERSSAARAEGLSPRCPARRASAFAPPWGSIDGDNCCHTFYGRHIWHAEVLLWRSLPMATAVNCLYSWSSKIRVQTSSVFDVLNECIHLECTFLLTYWNLTMQHLLNSGVVLVIHEHDAGHLGSITFTTQQRIPRTACVHDGSGCSHGGWHWSRD